MNYNFRDLTGKRFGKQTVLERDTDGIYPSGKLVRWKCKCDCGNIKTIVGCNLPNTKSCGCDMHKRPQKEDLTGQRFGILTVVERADNKIIPCGQSRVMWKCVCDCGSVVIVRGATLKNGDTRSCGCVKSYGEKTIAQYLNSLGITFKKEYMFKDCVNANGNKLRFDFAIFKQGVLSCLIEYQGEQHYYPPQRNPDFGAQQRNETDEIKKEYCKTHNILLYEIRFDENIKSRIDSILQDNTVPTIVSND